MRIGIGRPSQSGGGKHHVLRNFAKSDRAWLEPLLAAIAAEAPDLAEERFDKFQSRVAHVMQDVAMPQEPSPPVQPEPAPTLGARLRRWFGT